MEVKIKFSEHFLIYNMSIYIKISGIYSDLYGICEANPDEAFKNPLKLHQQSFSMRPHTTF